MSGCIHVAGKVAQGEFAPVSGERQRGFIGNSGESVHGKVTRGNLVAGVPGERLGCGGAERGHPIEVQIPRISAQSTRDGVRNGAESVE